MILSKLLAALVITSGVQIVRVETTTAVSLEAKDTNQPNRSTHQHHDIHRRQFTTDSLSKNVALGNPSSWEDYDVESSLSLADTPAIPLHQTSYSLVENEDKKTALSLDDLLDNYSRELAQPSMQSQHSVPSSSSRLLSSSPSFIQLIPPPPPLKNTNLPSNVPKQSPPSLPLSPPPSPPPPPPASFPPPPPPPSLPASPWLNMKRPCNGKIVERKEVRQLTMKEWREFVSAVRALHVGPAPTLYDRLAVVHQEYANNAHGLPDFLPWHRLYLVAFQEALWKVNPNVVLPYWKWSVDSQMPHASEVLSSRYFGGNGDQSRGGCLSTGYFANWGSLYVDGEDSTTVTCVTRRYDLGERMSPFYSPEAINAIIASAKTYDELRTILEGAPHGNIHVGLGGSFTSMASSSDPLFWVHHAYVDMIWWQWQKRNTKHLRDFGGVVDDSTETRDLNSIVEPFNVANGDALNTEGPGLCYRYVDYTPTSSLKQRLQHTAAASAASASSPGISTDHDVLSDVLVMDDQDPRLMQMLVDAWNTTDTPSAHGMVTSSSSSSSSSSLTNSQLLIPMDAVNSVDTAIQSSLINRLVRGDVIEHTDQAYLDAIYKAAMLNNEFQLVTQVTKDAPILVQLSTPKPLPDDYIAMNRLSRERVREGEAHLRHTISVVNQLSNYVSPASLLARQDEILRTTSDALRYGQGWAVKVIEELHPILHRFERRLRDIMHVLRQKKHH